MLIVCNKLDFYFGFFGDLSLTGDSVLYDGYIVGLECIVLLTLLDDADFFNVLFGL